MLTCVATIGSWGQLAHGQAVRSWTAGDGTWNDGAGNNANWSGADEPDSDDTANFNTNVSVDLGTDNVIAGLTMSNSSELHLVTFNLDVGGNTTLSQAGTRLTLDGGTLESFITGAGNALLAVNIAATLSGNGQVLLTDTPAATTTLLDNNGTISAINPVTIIISPPAAATLAITASDADARIDLDGSLESGTVTVSRNQTLDVNAQLSDVFNGAITMSHNTELNMSNAWILGTNATLQVNNGAVGGIPATPAGTATIAGSSFSQNAGTITVTDADGTLEFDAPFTMNGGLLTNNGLVVFNANATVAVAANLTMAGNTASLTVAPGVEVNIDQSSLNIDGNDMATNVIIVGAGGILDLDMGAGADESLSGTINLNGGELDVTTASNSWLITRVVNVGANTGTSQLNGESLSTIGAFNVGANSRLEANAQITLGAGGTYAGAGALAFNSSSSIVAASTINTGAFDWDGSGGGQTHTINNGVIFTINSATFDDDGDMDDAISLGGNGAALEVNGVASWEMRGTLTANSTNVGEAGINGSARMVLTGAGSTLNVVGSTNLNAKVTFGASSTTTIAAGEALKLNGGNTSLDPNRITGGTINGPGQLTATPDHVLYGNGTIAAPIDFGKNNTALGADDGTLNVTGNIIAIDTIGTRDADGVLNVANAWNSNVVDFVSMNGGELKGGTITVSNTDGIRGFGKVSSRVLNNTRLRAENGTLIVETVGNDNDWDGAGAGILNAVGAGAVLEIRDTGAAFGFTGTVSATTGARVFANGFALDFNPGSALNLTNATYESNSSTDIGGTVTVAAGGPSTIKVENNFFLTFETGSSTTLNGNLQILNNNTTIEQGAAFSGSGALVIPAGSHLVADNLADVDVLLDMQGAFRPGNSEGIGRIDLFDYQMTSTSQLYVELTGTGLNAFDRLVASGDVIVGGFLSIDIDGAFVPALGNTFNIITGNTVSGQFSLVDVSGMPANLAFHVNYLSNAVQLQVVPKPLFSADFDDDGDVDKTDLDIWFHAINLNQLGDADGDNDSDGADFLAWQRQFGSAPAVAVGQPVPEPATAALALTVCVACILVRRRGR